MALSLLLVDCSFVLPTSPPTRDATTDLIWENRSDDRYFVVITDDTGRRILDWVATIEPCQRAGVWDVRVPWRMGVRFPLAGNAAEPTVPDGPGYDFSVFRHSTQSIVRIAEDAQPGELDMMNGIKPDQPQIEPFEPEPLC